MDLISFRELKSEDLDLLVNWLNKPYVRKWYSDKNAKELIYLLVKFDMR